MYSNNNHNKEKDFFYFNKVLKLFKELKEEYPHIEISRHYCLATSDSNGNFLSDKDLYELLQQHKTELDINTLSDESLDTVIRNGENLFNSDDSIFFDDEDPEYQDFEDYN